MAISDISAETLRECVSYDPETGHFTRKKKTNRRVVVGARADFKTTRGYCRIVVENVRMYAHQAAWLYVHGYIPDAPIQIDHINCEKSDNRISNLRAATPSVNSQNIRSARPGTRSGLLGVNWSNPRKKWRAQIRTGDSRLLVGYFDDKYEAHEAYLSAKRALHEGCTI